MTQIVFMKNSYLLDAAIFFRFLFFLFLFFAVFVAGVSYGGGSVPSFKSSLGKV